MTDETSKAGREAARTAREERLAAALRANLRRRKAGSRERTESPKSSPPEPEATPGDERK
jgi:hypothetical protein